MKFSEIFERISGLSCPLFGVSWVPPVSDRREASAIVAFLEDRRVLFNPLAIETPDHCLYSVLEIRKRLTQLMERISPESELYSYAKAMRIACREFANKCEAIDLKKIIYHYHHDFPLELILFSNALGELRSTFGIMLAQIAVVYGIDIEDDLAKILPSKEVRSSSEV